MNAESLAPKGIGGWLVLVAIGLVVSPLRLIHLLWTAYLPLVQGGGWALLTTPGSEAYHPYWRPLLIFEVASNIFLIVLGLFAAYHFLERRGTLRAF